MVILLRLRRVETASEFASEDEDTIMVVLLKVEESRDRLGVCI